MAFNQQQFIQSAKSKGYTDEEINTYLQNKGLVDTQEQPVEKNKASGGFLGYVAPMLSTLPQAIGSLFGAREISKLNESELDVQNAQADLAMQISKKLKIETDPAKKELLKKQLADISTNMQERGARMSELASGKGLEKATSIKLMGGNLANIPGLSVEPKKATMQIGGRAISQIGVGAGQMLGPTGAGAVIGAGRAIEAGKSPLGIATESAGTALLFKATGFGFDKLSKTGIGQKVLTSPVGSTILNIGNKVFSPFMAKPVNMVTPTNLPFGLKDRVVKPFSNELENAIDTSFKNFGNAVDKLYSPSTYLKPAVKGLEYVGQKTGLAKTPGQKETWAKDKIENFWQGYKNGYKKLVTYDKNSPKILAREGIIPTKSGQSMITSDQSELLKIKASSEHSLLNKVLDESKVYVSVDDYRKLATNNILNNFKGVEREQALNAFNNQFNSLISQNKSQIVEGNRMPIKLFNDWKSYMWSQGYASKIAPKPEQISAQTMRLSGNVAKNYINNVAEKESKELSDAIIGLNEHSSELWQAQKFLDAMNGQKLSYGKIGRHFARVVGAIVGSQGGVLGSIAGSMTADQIVSLLQNPQVSVGKAAIIIAQLKQTNPKAVEQALNYLKSNATVQQATKQLPKPSFVPGKSGGGGADVYYLNP